MIFQHTWQQVLDGSKTQTRRLVQLPPEHRAQISGEYLYHHYIDDFNIWDDACMKGQWPGEGVYTVHYKHGGWLSGDTCVEPEWWYRALYIVGRTYAVQPGRGKPAIGRIRITAIRQERLQEIDPRDAAAEGVEIDDPFGKMSSGSSFDSYLAEIDRRYIAGYAELWDSIHTKPGTRWDDNPLVWVLEFEREESTS